MIPVESSNLRAVDYDAGRLFVAFHGGTLYEYYNVPYATFTGLLEASSHGEYFHAHIKNRYRYRPAMISSDTKIMLSEMAAEAADLKRTVGGSLTDVVADWLVPQYVTATREQLAAGPTAAERYKILRLAANDLVALRRGDHSGSVGARTGEV